MPEYPEKLANVLNLFDMIEDRAVRMELLISYSERFKSVPESVASRPFPDDHRAPNCESESYVWAELQNDSTLKFYFAVENPQGLSAKAMAAILDECLSGADPQEIADMPADFAMRLFGNELSMGKNMGLTGMIHMVQAYARQILNARTGSIPE